jgi:hypothetical protein
MTYVETSKDKFIDAEGETVRGEAEVWGRPAPSGAGEQETSDGWRGRKGQGEGAGRG